ncbi:putative Zn finger protein [Micromonospora pisi]|uniref:Putative Zn finger protein n=1 Tax=Micromonospora pisi TaxID=589240 RepID=A0A495JUC4_9ACTN|nr:SWIM zinc finger family protein [Micromonospora pisi]RKR92135.1 putative Zn finger protein [Micromonospora pisi]
MSGDEVLGFPAFPKGMTRVPRFARSWWGRAWLTAMEETALDTIQLRKGRRFAYGGHVGSITVSPGRLAATVYGDDGGAYQTVVEVERLGDEQWDRFVGAVTAKAGHLAALLDGDVPRELVEAAQDVDVRLLPGLGELQPHCSCPDWEFPCRHAAALCYQAAWLIDTDPFVLLLLRGRGATELLGDLRRQPPEPEPEPVTAPAGVTAAQAYALPVAALPPVPPDLPEPAADALLPTVVPGPGVEPVALRRLVADAARRARALRAGSGRPR